MILVWCPALRWVPFSPVECRFEPVFPRSGLELRASTRSGCVRGKQARITWKKDCRKTESPRASAMGNSLDELNHHGCWIQWDACLIIGNPACMGIPVIFDVDCLPIDAGHSRCRFRHIRCRPVDDDIGSEQAILLVPAPQLPNGISRR